MSKPQREPSDSSVAETNCPKCGAHQLRDRRLCWLCGGWILPTCDRDDSATNQPAAPPVAPQPFSYSLSTLMLVMTLASICFGLLAVAPGLAVPMCVLLVPVFVRTAMVVRRREASGLAVSSTEKVTLFIGSFGVATVVAVVVGVAAFCSFCGVCLLAVSVDNSYGGPGWFLGGILMFAIAGVSIRWVARSIKWIRRRYRHDANINEPWD